MSTLSEWEGKDSEIAKSVNSAHEESLRVYKTAYGRIVQEANAEEIAFKGDYSRRQVYELIQNGADQLVDFDEGKVSLTLNQDALYCANEGIPIDKPGIEAITGAHISSKKGNQIGRFGLGFKSVLAISDNPIFLGRTGSFEFDKSRSSEVLKGLINKHHPDKSVDIAFPVLRLAWSVNPDTFFKSDPLLKEFSEWATTIIKLPFSDIDEKDVTRLENDFFKFRPEFLLFSRHVSVLELDDRKTLGNTGRRIISLNPISDNEIEISDQQLASTDNKKWRLFKKIHTFSEAEKTDLPELFANRESAEISWAIDDKASDSGEFWNFFPTDNTSTLSGIVNAPWKVSNDRVSLLDSPANRGLIESAAKLVRDSLAFLVNKEDPGNILDILPARGAEDRASHWAAGEIVERVDLLVSESECIPDQDGILRKPEDLKASPNRTMVLRKAAEIWSEFEGRPKDWFHPSVHQNLNRYSTAVRLKEKKDGLLTETRFMPELIGSQPIDVWLEALIANTRLMATDSTREGAIVASACAIRTAAQCLSDSTDTNRIAISDGVRESRVILTDTFFSNYTDTGPLSVPDWENIDPEKVFIQSTPSHSNPLISMIEPKILLQPGIPEALEQLNIRIVTPKDHLESYLYNPDVLRTFDNEDWEEFWEICKSLDMADLETLGGNKHSKNNLQRHLKVKTSGGSFKAIDSCMYSGEIITEKTDPELAVDEKFHAATKFILDFLDVSDVPAEADSSFEAEPWFEDYQEEQKEAYILWYTEEYLKRAGNEEKPTPDRNLLKIELRNQIAPLESITKMSEEGKINLTKYLLEKPYLFGQVEISHKNNIYPKQSRVGPIEWLLRKYGLLETEFYGPTTPEDTFGPDLMDWSKYLPVATGITTEISDLLKLPSSLETMSESSFQELEDELGKEKDDRLLGHFYYSKHKREPEGEVPERIFARVGNSINALPTSEVVVVSGVTEFRHSKDLEQPVLLVEDPDKASVLSDSWGLKKFTDEIQERVESFNPSDPEPLTEIFPMLDVMLKDNQRGVKVIYCESIEVSQERESKSISTTPSEHYDLPSNTLYISKTSENPDQNETNLLNAVVEFLKVDLGDDKKDILLKHKKDDEQRRKENKIRDVKDINKKLLLLLGPENIRSRLPENLLAMVKDTSDKPLDDYGLTNVAHARYGIMILKEYSESLRESGYEVPETWSGSQAAVRFVSNLGFPVDYAGQRGSSRESSFSIPGKKDLPELHWYQKKVTQNLEGLLTEVVENGSSPQKRGLISLPTGSGKTRVAVQGLSEWLEQSDVPKQIILWVADSYELCEQAVISWAEVWNSLGNEKSLRISRLWDSNEINDSAGVHVVVATIQKLNSIINRYDDGKYDEYDWLREPDCVIIDEAHGETTATFVGLRRWLRLEQQNEKNTKSIYLGLTATAFRGISEQNSKRLANTFNKNRLDWGVFDKNDPVVQLQKEGFLAKADHEELTGSDLELNDQEQKYFGLFNSMPGSVDDRLEKDKSRNISLINHIEQTLKSKSSILVFATTVNHAQAISAVLTLKGIDSACIDSQTDPSARIHAIQQFREKKIQVLTNCYIVAEGFDAPAVDAVYIARPVYSPNSYVQMIGRGLRGPKNGGKERCLIVNVEDTVTNFGKARLIWHEFEHVWSNS